MIVMKFGGTSLADAERIRTAAKIIESKKNQHPIVVCSAVSQITNKLTKAAQIAQEGKFPKEIVAAVIDKHERIMKDLDVNPKDIRELFNQLTEVLKSGCKECYHLDHMQSFGERMSCRIVAAYLSKRGLEAQAHDAYDIGMVTCDTFGNAEPLPESYKRIQANLKGASAIPIITGFIGKCPSGEITTLSRGGSDYTASIIGSAMGVEEIQIWTDVDGVMSTDPRIVSDAQTIESLSFDEASELAIYGAKVLHPKSIIPAMEKKIPVRVLNTHNPSSEGTVVVSRGKKTNGTVKAIAYRKGIALINIHSSRMLNAYGYLAMVFDVFKKYKKSVDMIATSEVNVSMTINDPAGISPVVKELQGFSDVLLEKEKAVICIVGDGMRTDKEITGSIFSTLADAHIGVEMISQGASQINVSFVVNESQADKAVKILHEKLIT